MHDSFYIIGSAGTRFGPHHMPREQALREAALLTAESGVVHRVEAAECRGDFCLQVHACEDSMHRRISDD